jgi:hypothetical protein
MPDLQDGEPGIVEIQNRLAGLFEYFSRQNAWPGAEIMNYLIVNHILILCAGDALSEKLAHLRQNANDCPSDEALPGPHAGVKDNPL